MEEGRRQGTRGVKGPGVSKKARRKGRCGESTQGAGFLHLDMKPGLVIQRARADGADGISL